MSKRNKHLREILRRTIFIGFGIQILLGIGWMACAIADALARGDSAGGCILCLLRVGLAWLACAYFLAGMEGDSVGRNDAGTSRCRVILWIAYNGLGLATFPMALQCCMTSDGKSVSTSLLLLAAACVVRVLRSDAGHPLRKADRLLLCLLALAAGGSVLYGAVTQTDTEENPGTWLASRFAWSTLAEAEKEWPEELTEAAGNADILMASYYPEELERTMVPALEEKLGTDGATDFLIQITKFALQYDPVRIAKDIFWDAAGYTFSPIVAQLQLAGRAYESLTGRNYEEILRVQPYLGKLYFDYGCKWYIVLLALTALLWAAGRFARSKRKGIATEAEAPGTKRPAANRLAAILPWAAAVLLIVYCTMRRGGLMDYRNTVYVVYLMLGNCAAFCDADIRPQELEHGEGVQKL